MAKKKQPTLSALRKKAWKLLSEMVRRTSADEGGTVDCYTCGKLLHWKESHAGHAIPGRTNAVLLDADIIRTQCPPCNIWRGGMYHVFSTKLIKENGLEWWEEKLARARHVVKYTRDDLEKIIAGLKRDLAEWERDRG